MDLDISLLLYFDKRRTLLDMKDACKHFLDQLDDKTVWKFPPLRYLLEVDVIFLFEILPELGDFLLKEPLRWQQHCNDVLYACLRSIDNNMMQYVQATQLAVSIRLTSYPGVFTHKKHRKYDHLICLEGLLIDISKTTNYVYHSVWSCNEECEGNETILHYIPKVPPKCILCKGVLFENSGLRRCGDRVSATFQLKYELLPRTLTVFDDNIEKLQLGSRYVIHTVVLKKIIIVWSVEEVLPNPAPLTSPTPPDIRQLYDACNGVPWKFIYCLASSIGVNICPLNCFMNVKINILFSLTSVKAHCYSNSQILHIVVGGLDTGYVVQLMSQAATLADSCTFLATSQNSVSLAIIAASGGVCLLPLPFQNYNQKQIHSLLSIIENGKISSDENEATLRCAIWAQGMDFKKITVYNIGNVFGNICRGDQESCANELVDYHLENAINPTETTEEETQALQDISIYLNVVAGVRVSFTEKAETLLHNYFLAARKESPKAVAIGNLGALITTCATSARLCRRTAAHVHDAVFSIWLHIGGMPEQKLAPEEYLETPADIKTLDTVMKKFITWLEQFTGCPIL